MHQVKSLLVAVASSLLGLATAVAQPVPGLGAAGPADAAPKSPPAPLSARLGVVLPANVARVDLPGINLEEVLTQDAAPNQLRVRTGVSVPLDGFDPGMGQYLDVPGGGWLWVLDVRAPGARGVRVHFTDFNLPEGAQAIVYDPNAPASAPSPYTGRGPVDSGEFWAWTCFGERARVEVFLPADLGQARFNRYFKIDQALHIYRDPATGQATPYGARELSCHNDLQCYPEWTPIGQGVGCMSFVVNGEGFTCSGSMLSTGAGDLTPYFATARHCMEDNTGALQSLEVYWFFERTGCNGAWPELANCPHSAVASYVLTTPLSDTSLVMIEGRIPRNLYWLAQDPSPVPDGTEIRGIHHPRGTRKRISFGATLTGAICDDSGLWNGISIDWNNGVTEPGSSGSPLLRADGRFIGVCSCGIDPPRCPASGYEAKYGSWASHSGTYAGYMSAGADDSYENNDSCGSAYNLNSLYNGTLYGLVVKIYDDD